MSKYIDADRLKAEITGWRNKQMGFAWDAVNEVLNIITSLQQEQTDEEEDDGKFVKISVRKEFAEQLQKLGNEIQSGQFSFIGAMNQREQPHVDLIMEYDEQFNSDPVYGKLTNRNAGIAIARHFYELGLTARKEE